MNFDKNIDRARLLLDYGTPEEAMQALVDSGETPEDAFLLVRAAQVVPSPPPETCPCCGNEGRHKMSCSFVK